MKEAKSSNGKEDMIRVYLLPNEQYWQPPYLVLSVQSDRRIAYLPGKLPRDEDVLASMLVKEGINVYDIDQVEMMIKKLKRLIRHG